MTLIQRVSAWRKEERAAGRKPTEYTIPDADVNPLARALLSSMGHRLDNSMTDPEKIKHLEEMVTSGGIRLFDLTIRVEGKERVQ